MEKDATAEKRRRREKLMSFRYAQVNKEKTRPLEQPTYQLTCHP